MNTNWQVKKLGEVCRFIGGSQPPKTLFSDTEKESYVRLIQIRDYKSDKHIVYIPLKDAKRFCNEDDIMIGRYGPPVFQILKGLKGAYNVALMKAVPDEKVLNRDYVHIFLKYSEIQDYIIRLSERAAGQTGINKDALEVYPIPIPPLPEQQRIVAILDETFAAIDKAKENAQKNLQNARELFNSYLQSVFTNPGADWEEKSLSSICEVKDGTHDSPIYVENGIPFVTQKNIREDGLSLTNTKFISIKDHEDFYRRSNATYGDILMSMIGANRGMSCLVDDEKVFSIKNVALIKASQKINQSYLLHFLKSPVAQKYVKDNSNGGAQEFIGLTQLRKFPIILPSLEEQHTIVTKLGALSIETKKLEAIYLQKLTDLDELKKAILQKAFRGELTATSANVVTA